jgi:hypothetical protein
MKPKDFMPKLREAFKQTSTQLNGLIEFLRGPERERFQTLKSEFDSVLEQLPPTDMVAAADEANRTLDCYASALYGAQCLMGYLTESLNKLRASVRADYVLASDVPGRINSAVESEISNRLASGKLLTPEKSLQLCAEAATQKENALNLEFAAREKKWKADQTLAETRATALKGENLPVPPAAILVLDDAAFIAAKTAAGTRIKAFADLGMSLNSAVVQEAAWAEESAFQRDMRLARDMKASLAGASGYSGAAPMLTLSRDSNPGAGNAAPDLSGIPV